MEYLDEKCRDDLASQLWYYKISQVMGQNSPFWGGITELESTKPQKARQEHEYLKTVLTDTERE